MEHLGIHVVSRESVQLMQKQGAQQRPDSFSLAYHHRYLMRATRRSAL
jgi:hypothetical protein